MSLRIRLFGRRSVARFKSVAARAAKAALEPLESRVLMYSDSPCGTWAPPTPPDF